MHPSLLETAPTLHQLLTHANNLAQFGVDNLIAFTHHPACHAQTVAAVLDGFAQDESYLGRRLREAQEAWDKAAPSFDGRAWGRLLAAKGLPESPSGVATVARRFDLPFVQIFVPQPNENTFGPYATVVFTLFDDGSFLAHNDGRLAVPDDWQEAALHLDEATMDDLVDDVASGMAVVLTHHGMEPFWEEAEEDGAPSDDAQRYQEDTLVAEMQRIWHDHDDPPFDERSEEWSNIDETPVRTQLLDLFLALGNPTSALEFTLMSASNDGDAGVNTDTLESDGFPEDLFLAIAKATINFTQLSGGQWEYNDGPRDRQSGYNFDTAIEHLTYTPDDWNAASAHARLRARDHLLEMARTDSRLEELRTDILNTLFPSDKDIAA